MSQKAIRCPFCKKIQPLKVSHNYGNKCLTILICILLAGITAAATIISICFLIAAFCIILHFRRSGQICNNCKKTIEEPTQYEVPNCLLFKILNCNHGDCEQLVALNSLIIAAAENDSNKFQNSFYKIHFLEFSLEENKTFLKALYDYRPSTILIQSVSYMTFERFVYKIRIDQNGNIIISNPDVRK